MQFLNISSNLISKINNQELDVQKKMKNVPERYVYEYNFIQSFSQNYFLPI